MGNIQDVRNLGGLVKNFLSFFFNLAMNLFSRRVINAWKRKRSRSEVLQTEKLNRINENVCNFN
jgi:hypothetical protein